MSKLFNGWSPGPNQHFQTKHMYTDLCYDIFYEKWHFYLSPKDNALPFFSFLFLLLGCIFKLATIAIFFLKYSSRVKYPGVKTFNINYVMRGKAVDINVVMKFERMTYILKPIELTIEPFRMTSRHWVSVYICLLPQIGFYQCLEF